MRNDRSTTKVFVAMSGGVDSSVAAALLQRKGYAVVGVHLKCWNVDGCAEQDAEDARRAAETLGIPFYVWDMEKEYRARVVNYMIRGYRSGETPNPDVMCNKEIKFGLFFRKARALGANYIATGHYVRLRRTATSKQRQVKRVGDSLSFAAYSLSLFVAKDCNKDQSYFLWTLTQGQLRHCFFPIGDYVKPRVRAMARKFKLPNAEKKDSQGICFLGKVMLTDFLGQYIPEKDGEIRDVRGEKIGEHRGAQFYTIGQRHLGVANSKWQRANSRNKDPQPLYVSEKDMRTNTLVVAEGDGHPALYRKEVQLANVNFIRNNLRFALGDLPVYARVRYRQLLAQAILERINPKTYQLTFAEPQKFVAPGQSAVFYSRRGELLGGGVIV